MAADASSLVSIEKWGQKRAIILGEVLGILEILLEAAAPAAWAVFSTYGGRAKILAQMNEELPKNVSIAKLPGNVKLLGLASLLNDIASEMIFPLMPAFLIGVLGGDKIHSWPPRRRCCC
jgi:hypothetical protein